MSLFFVLLVAAALAVLYLWYATIVARKNRVGEALGGIDAQLQNRHDLIPNVLAIARRFMEHERTLLDDITRLRAAAAPKLGERDFAKIADKFATEARLGADVGQIFALAENYPDLRSDGPMIEAQNTYLEVENNIAAARRFYNSAVGSLSTAIQIFPGPLLAGLAGVKTLPPFFEAPEAVRAPIDATRHL